MKKVMKMQVKLFLCSLPCFLIFSNPIESKTQVMNKDEIIWEKNGKENSHSLYGSIDGYVENGTIVLFLYDKPDVAMVTIVDDTGYIIYESIMENAEVLAIKIDDFGEYKVIIEYNTSMYIGTFYIK